MFKQRYERNTPHSVGRSFCRWCVRLHSDGTTKRNKICEYLPSDSVEISFGVSQHMHTGEYMFWCQHSHRRKHLRVRWKKSKIR